MRPLSSVSSTGALTPSPHLSFLTFLLGTASLASAQTIWMQFNPVSSALNSTDDFLIPLTLGSNQQVVNLSPSLGQNVTTVIGPKACTPSGQKAPVDQCVLYRGGVFDSSASSTFTSGSGEFSYRNQAYVTYSTGPRAKDSIYLPGEDGALEVKDYDLAVIESSNMTSGMLGLAKDSVLLQRLFEDGKIASKSFGLHVGVDIWNHPWPVLNPSFDESGDKPTTKDDLNTGTGKRDLRKHRNFAREETDENELPVRESHKFPGSLTLGGYDKAKISNKTKPITIPIAKDGTLQLSLTKIVARNSKVLSPFNIIEKPFKVVIDADTPYMYFPYNISRGIGEALSAFYGDPGIDFFYTYLADRERYLGNVTMTFKAPNGEGDEIEIMIPPTVWYQPIGYMRNFKLVGDPSYNYGAPMREWTRSQEASSPIILGRSFLKAAYLFVNYEANEFQIAQVAFANKTQDIVTVKPGQDISIGNGTSSGNSKNGTDTGADEPKASTIPIPILAGAAGGGAALVVILIVILVCLKKRRNREKAKQGQQLQDRPNTGVSDHLPVGGRMELDPDSVAMVKLSRPSTEVSGAISTFDATHAELPENNAKPAPPELPAGGFNDKAGLGGNTYAELGTKHDYHEMPSTAVSTTMPQQAHTPTSPHPAIYPPPSPSPVSPHPATYPPPSPSPVAPHPATYPPPSHSPVSPHPATYPPPSHSPVSPHPATYPPPPHSPPINMPSAPGFPGYNYQPYPPPPSTAPSTFQQYPPPPGPPPTNIYPAGYVPPPPPPNPPPQGAPYTYAPPKQYPGQVYQPHARPSPDPHARASLHEMA